jgi:hypothetical protein
MYLRRVRVVGRCIAAALTQLSTVVTPPAPAAHNLGVGFRRACRSISLERDGQISRCSAERGKYYWLYLYSVKETFAVMYRRRVRADGRSFAAVLSRVSKICTPPAPAAQNLGVGLQRPLPGTDVWRHEWRRSAAAANAPYAPRRFRTPRTRDRALRL